MTPNRRGVNVGERKMVVGEKVAHKVTKKRVAKKVAKKVVKKRVAEVAETWNRTFPSVTSVRNLGNSPKVPAGGRSLPGSLGGRVLVRLNGALWSCCPWLLFRRRGVHIGKDLRGHARMRIVGAAIFCAKLRSLCI